MSCQSGYVKDMANVHCILESECLLKQYAVVKNGKCACDVDKGYVLNYAQNGCWTIEECSAKHYGGPKGDYCGCKNNDGVISMKFDQCFGLSNCPY